MADKRKVKMYSKAHSGAGGGSHAYGCNRSRGDTRPPFAAHGSAPHKSVDTKVPGK